MRPLVPSVLPEAIQLLRAHAEAAPGTQLANDLQSVVRCLAVITDEFDGCAARGAAEVQTLSGLLARGARLSAGRFAWEGDLSAEAVDDLRISALEARMDVLRDRAIELQAWLETASSQEAAAVLRELYEFQHTAAKARVRDLVHW